jgi:hypothetical protein
MEAKTWLWIALLASASVLFSLALACAAPLAALAALAALNMNRRDAAVLVMVAWLANQAVGYGLLGYPQTVDSFAWGIAIGWSSLFALGAAMSVDERLSEKGPVVTTAAAFLAAFAVYEAALYGTSFLLPAGDVAFSLATIGWILAINILAMVLLLALNRFAIALGLTEPPEDYLVPKRA